MVRWFDEEGPEPTPARRVAERRALRELERLYRESDSVLEGFGCPACGACCELARTRFEPYLMPVERLLIERWLREQGRTWPKARADGACAFQGEDKRCTVYPVRAFGCRTYFCRRGTGPKAPPNDALHALSARLVALSDELDPDARPAQISRFFPP